MDTWLTWRLSYWLITMNNIVYIKKYYVTYSRVQEPYTFYEEVILAKDDVQAAKRAISLYGPLLELAVMEYQDFLFYEEDMSLDSNYPFYWDDTDEE